MAGGVSVTAGRVGAGGEDRVRGFGDGDGGGLGIWDASAALLF